MVIMLAAVGLAGLMVVFGLGVRTSARVRRQAAGRPIAHGYPTAILITAIVMAVAVLVLYTTGADLCAFLSSKHWRTAQGMVLDSQVEIEEGRDDRLYRAAVRYVYTVEGRQYTGGRVFFSQGGAVSRPPAERIVTRYPAGKAVAVSYDPANPQKAVLERRIYWTVYAILIGDLLILSGGMFLSGMLVETFVGSLSGPGFLPGFLRGSART